MSEQGLVQKADQPLPNLRAQIFESRSLTLFQWTREDLAELVMWFVQVEEIQQARWRSLTVLSDAFLRLLVGGMAGLEQTATVPKQHQSWVTQEHDDTTYRWVEWRLEADRLD